MGPHSSNIQKNCAVRDKSTKFGTLVERHIMKRFGYLATTDLASEGHGSHFTKWRRGDIKMATRGIKMAMASTFVERFHRLWGLWMHLTAYYKRMGLNFRNSKFLGGREGGIFQITVASTFILW